MSLLTEEELGKVEGIHILRQPEPSEWKCYLFGNSADNQGIIWVPNKGCEPNWFWRKMQYLVLGNKWEKKSNE